MPFLILGLPRSRTAWLAHWLVCTHDIAIECDTVDDLLTHLATSRGSCETGAVDGWRLIRRAIPGIAMVTVHRPAGAVIDRLRALGCDVEPSQIERRAELLAEASGSPNTFSIDHKDIADPECCRVLRRYCLREPFDYEAWRIAIRTNVQVDLVARMKRLNERRANIEALKAEVADRLENPRSFVLIRFEPWAECAEECAALGAGHYDEARAGNEGEFDVNISGLQQLADSGLFYVCTARIDGRLVGYCLWSKEVSFETKAQQTAIQGPFYVLPGLTAHRIGQRLLDVSESGLQAAGFKVFDYHHTMLGRGAKAGVIYRRRGAVPHQMHYRRKVA
jgi:GNAT superfamily N-acetyltransferase